MAELKSHDSHYRGRATAHGTGDVAEKMCFIFLIILNLIIHPYVLPEVN